MAGNSHPYRSALAAGFCCEPVSEAADYLCLEYVIAVLSLCVSVLVSIAGLDAPVRPSEKSQITLEDIDRPMG